MALDLSLLRWSLLPRFIQTGNGEPRKAHYLGKENATPVERKQETGGKGDQPPKKPATGKYTPLSELTLGEVEEALVYFLPQLVEPLKKDWIAKNYFCQIPLKRNMDGRPAVVFGRMTSTYPTAGELENIEELEMHFPRRNAHPDLLRIHIEEINRRKPIESFCVGVKAYLSEQEMADFSRSENIFIEKGFAPLYENGYGDLLEIDELHHPVLPWIYVFGSEWFATIPDSMQLEVKDKLRSLVSWKRVVLNYHPKRYTLRYRSLNDELDYQYDFTKEYLVTPQDMGQVLEKVEETFREKFLLGME